MRLHDYNIGCNKMIRHMHVLYHMWCSSLLEVKVIINVKVLAFALDGAVKPISRKIKTATLLPVSYHDHLVLFCSFYNFVYIQSKNHVTPQK